MSAGPLLPSPGPRALWLDALRGAAMVWMVAYHFSFDLRHFGLAFDGHSFYRDALWTTQRTAIVTLFLLCAGLGQAQAEAAGQGWPRFWRRWAQVLGCALLVSAGSALMFPRSWISFGVLHGMALMLLLTRLLAPRLSTAALLVLGAVALALPHLVQHPVFDTRWTNWVGLMTRKPITEDHVPWLPWWGVMLWGLAWGRWCLGQAAGSGGAWARWATSAWATSAWARPLVWLGQRPLRVYMLHQPLLIGALMLWLRWR